jgi:hypothetical protein
MAIVPTSTDVKTDANTVTDGGLSHDECRFFGLFWVSELSATPMTTLGICSLKAERY